MRGEALPYLHVAQGQLYVYAQQKTSLLQLVTGLRSRDLSSGAEQREETRDWHLSHLLHAELGALKVANATERQGQVEHAHVLQNSAMVRQSIRHAQSSSRPTLTSSVFSKGLGYRDAGSETGGADPPAASSTSSMAACAASLELRAVATRWDSLSGLSSVIASSAWPETRRASAR